VRTGADRADTSEGKFECRRHVARGYRDCSYVNALRRLKSLEDPTWVNGIFEGTSMCFLAKYGYLPVYRAG
jgi:hypothetical protein